MVQEQFSEGSEIPWNDGKEAEAVLREKYQKLQDELSVLENQLEKATEMGQSEGEIYTIQDSVMNLKHELGNTLRDLNNIIQVNDKVTMKDSPVKKFPPHQ